MGTLTKKNFFGFLYHPGSEQILLQQKTNGQSPAWTLLENLRRFHPKKILPVYDYTSKGNRFFVSYAPVKDTKNYPAAKTHLFRWFTPKEIAKLPLSPQTKQDITVGWRVIASQIRRDCGQRTIG